MIYTFLSANFLNNIIVLLSKISFGPVNLRRNITPTAEKVIISS